MMIYRGYWDRDGIVYQDLQLLLIQSDAALKSTFSPTAKLEEADDFELKMRVDTVRFVLISVRYGSFQSGF